MISAGSFGMGPEAILPKRGIFMSKRKNWVAYCVLTVLAAVLLAFMPRYSTYLQAYGGRHYNYMPYIVVIPSNATAHFRFWSLAKPTWGGVQTKTAVNGSRNNNILIPYCRSNLFYTESACSFTATSHFAAKVVIAIPLLIISHKRRKHLPHSHYRDHNTAASAAAPSRLRLSAFYTTACRHP